MKTLYKYIFLCLSSVLAFSACTGKNEVIPPTGGLDHAEKLIEGTYVGTWTATNLNTGDSKTATGTVTFTSTDELGNNVVEVSIISDDTKAVNLGAKVNPSACNVSRLSSGILSFWNVYSLNPFGFTFTGKVTPEGDATFTYEKANVVNHIQTKFSYTFSGTKQQ